MPPSHWQFSCLTYFKNTFQQPSFRAIPKQSTDFFFFEETITLYSYTQNHGIVQYLIRLLNCNYKYNRIHKFWGTLNRLFVSSCDGKLRSHLKFDYGIAGRQTSRRWLRKLYHNFYKAGCRQN